MHLIVLNIPLVLIQKSIIAHFTCSYQYVLFVLLVVLCLNDLLLKPIVVIARSILFIFLGIFSDWIIKINMIGDIILIILFIVVIDILIFIWDIVFILV